MKNLLDVSAMLKLKEQGLSNRRIAKILDVNRKTVNKYWNQYKNNLQKLDKTIDEKEILEIQEDIVSNPKYNSGSRTRRKVTPEFIKALEKILEDFEKKLYNPNFIKEFEELETLEFINKKENIILVRYTWSRKNTLCNRIRNKSMYGRKDCIVHFCTKSYYRAKRSYE